MEETEYNPNAWAKLKIFVKECVRVFKITKKPTKEEFKTISKVAGLGILVIGFIGFIVHLIRVLIAG